LPSQYFVATLVLAGTRMLASVDLNNQPRFDIGKINNIGRDRKLPPDAPSKSIAAQFSPQQPLCVSHIPPQLPCAVAGG